MAGRPKHGQKVKDWRLDRDVLERVEVVKDVMTYPLSHVFEVVNAWLEQHGKAPISERTLYRDLARARDLTVERIGLRMEDHLADLEAVKLAAWRDVAVMRPEDRAPHYAIVIRCVEDQGRLLGTFTNGRGRNVPASAEVIEQFAASPEELLRDGKITLEEFETALRIGALMAEPDRDQPRYGQRALPPPEPPPSVQAAQHTNGHTPAPPPSFPRPGERRGIQFERPGDEPEDD